MVIKLNSSLGRQYYYYKINKNDNVNLKDSWDYFSDVEKQPRNTCKEILRNF